MSGVIVTEKRLRWLLEEKYGCKYDGKPMPPPYVSEDDMPTYYIAPSGLNFSVPPPPDGIGYRPSAVEAIVKAGKLDVVVQIGGKKLDPHKLLEEAPDHIEEKKSN